MQIPNNNNIEAFIHCSRCIHEIPEGIAPREWAELEVGWTILGIQVWCRRHEVNVLHMDFEGHKHPATSSTKIDVDSISW